MIWALLALLGIPLWFIALILIAAVAQRRSIQRTDGVFRYKVRGDKGWSRGKSVANWVSDVLIGHKGIALLRSEAQQVTAVELIGPPEHPAKGLGDEVVELSFTFAGGERVDVAVAEASLATAMGPFAVASSP